MKKWVKLLIAAVSIIIACGMMTDHLYAAEGTALTTGNTNRSTVYWHDEPFTGIEDFMLGTVFSFDGDLLNEAGEPITEDNGYTFAITKGNGVLEHRKDQNDFLAFNPESCTIGETVIITAVKDNDQYEMYFTITPPVMGLYKSTERTDESLIRDWNYHYSDGGKTVYVLLTDSVMHQGEYVLGFRFDPEKTKLSGGSDQVSIAAIDDKCITLELKDGVNEDFTAELEPGVSYVFMDPETLERTGEESANWNSVKISFLTNVQAGTETGQHEKTIDEEIRDAGLLTANAIIDFEGKKYLIDKDGGVFKGGNAVAPNGRRVYANPDGTLKVRELYRTKSGNFYYYTINGYMKTSGFIHLGDEIYYAKANGRIICGKAFKVGGKTYVANKDGTLMRNTTYTTKYGNVYKIDQNGVATRIK